MGDGKVFMSCSTQCLCPRYEVTGDGWNRVGLNG